MIYLSPKYLRLLAEVMDKYGPISSPFGSFDEFLNTAKFFLQKKDKKLHAKLVREELRMMVP